MRTLTIFTISHFCEKARWALDALGVPHAVEVVAPGLHRDRARELGAAGASVPILSAPDAPVVQGSRQIIDWAEDAASPDVARAVAQLTATERLAAREIETRLDAILGVQGRRYYYSEALIDQPADVLDLFCVALSERDRLHLRTIWPGLRQRMVLGMDLGAPQREDARRQVIRELDWLDEMLADGRDYLLGERFTRVDIAAAALMAPFLRPVEHPTYDRLVLPPKMQTDVAVWSDRPIFRWTSAVYAQHRVTV